MNTAQNQTLFNPNSLRLAKPAKMTTKQRNAARKATKRINAERAATAQQEATEAMKHESHLGTRLMKEIEREFGKRFTRAAGNTTYVLEQVELFNRAR